MEFKTEIKISPELLKVGNNLAAGIQAGLLRTAGAVEAAAMETAPVRTGELADRIRKYIDRNRAIISSTALYSIFVHEGTGLFGPRKAKIVPKTAKALRFRIGDKLIFARSVKGQKPNPYMRRALKGVEGRIPEIFNRAISDFINRA